VGKRPRGRAHLLGALELDLLLLGRLLERLHLLLLRLAPFELPVPLLRELDVLDACIRELRSNERDRAERERTRERAHTR
jgi:hypothetical protein